ncbi:DUF2752 domain-containing protein [Ascidiimonas aurantiaca]|uniref:DUF2752 domain-containing protein n=1 Tax=Ascidiimonas aurantiaca TaxID=1685432 RepID=UPI0030ED9588
MAYYSIGGIALILVLSLYYFIDPVETNLFPKCPFHEFTGLHCPGCGSQRALHALVHGRIFSALGHNLLIPLVPLVLLYKLYIKSALKNPEKDPVNLLHHPKTPAILFSFIMLFWILRNTPLYPFTLLAP